jgi:hypothetical protein
VQQLEEAKCKKCILLLNTLLDPRPVQTGIAVFAGNAPGDLEATVSKKALKYQ